MSSYLDDINSRDGQHQKNRVYNFIKLRQITRKAYWVTERAAHRACGVIEPFVVPSETNKSRLDFFLLLALQLEVYCRHCVSTPVSAPSALGVDIVFVGAALSRSSLPAVASRA